MNHHSFKFFEFEVFSGSLNGLVKELLSKKKLSVVNTINPHSYVTQLSDFDFSCSLKKSDLLLPDGIGVVLAAKIQGIKHVKKISGFDFFHSVMSFANEKKLKVFFLGSSDVVLNGIKNNCRSDYPCVSLSVYSPPFVSEFTSLHINDFAKAINSFSPDIVFVGLTAPKQEKLIFKLVEHINPVLISGVGAVFDFYSGSIPRAPKFFVNIGLEWLVRFLKQPRKMFRRNFISTPIFLYKLLIWHFIK